MMEDGPLYGRELGAKQVVTTPHSRRLSAADLKWVELFA